MPALDQLEYLGRREQQHRDFAARARSEPIRAFHERLVVHYSQLAVDTRQLATMRLQPPSAAVDPTATPIR